MLFPAGDDRHGSSRGPQLLETGVDEPLTSSGVAVTVERIDRDPYFATRASSSTEVNKELAAL